MAKHPFLLRMFLLLFCLSGMVCGQKRFTGSLPLQELERLQKDFLSALLRFAREEQYLFVVWFVPVDYDRLLAKLPAGDNAEAAKIWVNTGLFDGNVNPKSVWSIWQSLFK
jgi:hypothetical protein